MSLDVFTLPSWSVSVGSVVFLSLLLTAYELFKIFQPEFGRTLWNRYAFSLFALNVVAALFTWGVVHIPLGVRPTILSTLAAGLIFPILLRSRFTLYRTLAPPTSEGKGVIDELSLKMDEIYHSLQNALYKEIDRKLARERVALNKRVRDTFSASEIREWLEDVIGNITIDADREKLQEKLNNILNIPDEATRHRQLANLLIQLSDRRELQRAIRDKTLTPPS